ncbi:CRISPR-associated endonuclease Cas2 [Streptococcus suis]|nr:CRISPR-associated endonuclease Cas2 [Streptococcus suis]
MFVILVCDVSVKRTAKVLKTVRPYLSHLQRSVFEGETEDSHYFVRSASPL